MGSTPIGATKATPVWVVLANISSSTARSALNIIIVWTPGYGPRYIPIPSKLLNGAYNPDKGYKVPRWSMYNNITFLGMYCQVLLYGWDLKQFPVEISCPRDSWYRKLSVWWDSKNPRSCCSEARDRNSTHRNTLIFVRVYWFSLATSLIEIGGQ